MAIRPAQEKAVAQLRDMVRAAVRSGRRRLPPIGELSRLAGVAPGTMWRAVRRLSDEGVLAARPRSGIHVLHDGGADSGRTATLRAPPGLRWQRLRLSLERDIAAGVYLPNETLPTVKQLCLRYAVCFGTMKKALGALVDDRVLCAEKKGYRVPALTAARNRATILFAAWVVGDEIAGTLDSECSKAGIRLRTVPLFPHDTFLNELRRARAGAGMDALLGHLVSITGGTAEQYREILHILTPSNLPIAILDQTGGATGARLPGGRSLRVFSIACGRLPGRRMARYLLQQGHRRVAYLSPSHEAEWSIRRLQGMQEVFGPLGPDAVVLPFTSCHEPLGRKGSDSGTDHEIDRLSTSVLDESVPHQRYLARALRRLRSEINHQTERAAVEDEFRSVMERALVHRDITAWVAGNDSSALMCLEFLANRGVRVPGDISVAGFDDSTAGFTAGLTSYNHNRPAAIHAVLSYLLGATAQYRATANGQTVEVEGFVAARGSTGVPARAKQRTASRR